MTCFMKPALFPLDAATVSRICKNVFCAMEPAGKLKVQRPVRMIP